MQKIWTRTLSYGYRILLAIGIILGIYRLGYFVYAHVPLGYDPGMYKEIFSSYVQVLNHMDFSYLPSRVRHEPLLWILAALLHKLGVSFDRLVTRGIGILTLIPGLLLFRFFKSRKDPRTGVLAAILYRISIIQYEIFRRNYFKQTIGVSLMLLILILWEKKKLLLQSILFFLLILLHRHTAVFTWAILGLSVLLEWIQKKLFPWKKILARSLAGTLALLCYIPLRSRVMPEALKAVSTTFWGVWMGGDFMNIFSYLSLQWPVILLSLLWIRLHIKRKTIDVWSIGYIISCLRVLFWLVNFNRTIVFLDIFVIYFAAIALREIIHRGSKKWLAWIWISLVSIVCIWTAVYYLWYVAKRSVPLISEEELSSLKSLDTTLEQDAIVMVTHRNYAPWIMGWSKRTYITPGMSDMDKRTHLNWNRRWTSDGTTKCDMLKQTYQTLHRPFYIRLWQQQFLENLSGWDCFTLITKGGTWRLYKIF